jgi:hypothetical protein
VLLNPGCLATAVGGRRRSAGGAVQAAQPVQPFGGAADALVVIDVQRCLLLTAS